METIHETNDGIYYLTSALAILLKFFKSDSVLSNIISSGNDFLKIKNTLYFSAKDLKLAQKNLQSLNSIIYSPIFLILGANQQKEKTIDLLGKFSIFLGSNMLDLIASIQDYLQLMNELTHEILRRAYWWELEKNNITYNPKTDFYDKFNNKISLRLEESVSKFKIAYHNLGLEINSSFLDSFSQTDLFFTQMSHINSILDQVVYLSRLAPPLLNATFFSVEVTNALAFDQFITAKNLTDLSQQYIQQSQELLDNHSFDQSLSPAIADIGDVMNQFNQINHQFVNMTQGTANMFLSLDKIITDFNKTTYNKMPYFTHKELLDSIIKENITIVRNIINESQIFLKNDINKKGNYIGFPFRDIFSHFLWFYDGYDQAVDRYSFLWSSSKETIELFSEAKILLNNTNLIFDQFKTNSTLPNLLSPTFTSLYTNFLTMQNNITRIGEVANESVTDGALKINKTLWEGILGFNMTSYTLYNSGFNEFCSLYISFRNEIVFETNITSFFIRYDNYYNEAEMLLMNIKGENIFLSISEELSG